MLQQFNEKYRDLIVNINGPAEVPNRLREIETRSHDAYDRLFEYRLG